MTALFALAALLAAATPPPNMMVGACVSTRIAALGPRLEGDPNSGVGLLYADGLTQVSYNAIPALAGAAVGDPVRVCLVKRPRHCPAGDDRGKIYSAQDLRTGRGWTAADAEHSCGGA